MQPSIMFASQLLFLVPPLALFLPIFLPNIRPFVPDHVCLIAVDSSHSWLAVPSVSASGGASDVA